MGCHSNIIVYTKYNRRIDSLATGSLPLFSRIQFTVRGTLNCTSMSEPPPPPPVLSVCCILCYSLSTHEDECCIGFIKCLSLLDNNEDY